MKKRLLKWLLIFFALIVIAEISLRIFLDNAQRVLYKEDPYCEYRLVENQDVTRFHNFYKTNEYGMRSDSVRKSAKRRVLLLGDSVLNGGTKLDQSEIINFLLQKKFAEDKKLEIDFLNISAGSWGPENAFQFLEHYVDFEYDLIILIFSSHDFHDNMHHRKVVGIQPAWPDEQPYLAVTDLYTGYLKPKFKAFLGTNYDYLEGFDDSAVNPGWEHFFEKARLLNIPLVVFHHATINELRDHSYMTSGDSLEMLVRSNTEYYISGLHLERQTDYLDDIHLSGSGHALIADTLYNSIIREDLLNLNSNENNNQ